MPSRFMVLIVFGLGLLLLLGKIARRLEHQEWALWFVAAGSLQPLLVGNTALVQTDVTGTTLLFLVLYVVPRIEQAPSIGGRHALLLVLVQGRSVVTRYVNLAPCAGSVVMRIGAMRRGAIAGALLAPVLYCATTLSRPEGRRHDAAPAHGARIRSGGCLAFIREEARGAAY